VDYKKQIVTGLLRRFPEAGSLTLARIAYRENPLVWPRLEAARSAFRLLRGASGNGHRAENNGGKEFYREPRKSGDPFGAIPEGKTHFEDWKAYVLAGPLNALIIADLHIPYHKKTPLVAALKEGQRRKVDTVVLNGDVADFFSVSFWEKDPRERDLANEIKTVRDFLKTLRGMFPKARIVFEEGNHEERWERYLKVKAPELLGVPEFQIESVFQLDNVGIEYVGEKRPLKLGKLNVLHGHAFRFAIAGPVNPARGFFLKAKTHCIGSHLHHSSQHSEKNLEGEVISTWSTGCLCETATDYSPINNWNHGCAFVETDKAGAFQVDNKRIFHGKVY
jgi:predicted phosphodiesterase